MRIDTRTQLVYDVAGDLLRYIDADGAVRQYVYDPAHRMIGTV